MIFSFMGHAYEIPESVDRIEVFSFEDGCIDFDLFVNGEAVAMFGGTDEQGKRLPTWEDLGIRKV